MNNNERLRQEVQKLLSDLDGLKATAKRIMRGIEIEDANTLSQFLAGCTILHPHQGATPLDLYPFQQVALDAFEDHNRVVVAKSRQMGFSTIVALYALYLASTRSNYTIVVVASRLANAQELLSKARAAAETGTMSLPFVTEMNKSSMAFSNGSKIIARACTPDATRGTRIDCLIVDEAAYISHKTLDDFWVAQTPAITPETKIILASTPKLAEGLFYRIYKDACAGKNDFTALRYTWSDHPERDESWAQSIKNMIGNQNFITEHECNFISFDNGS